VAAGQVLLRLDRRDFAVALERAQAVAAGRDAALASLQAQLVQQRAMVRQAEADLRSRQSRAVFAEQDASRYVSLAATSAASRQQQQKASSAQEDAQASVAAGEAALAGATAQVAVLQGNIEGAQAGVGEAKAAVRAAELDLGYTEIRSPIDGYVGNRAAHVGAYVSTGAYLMSVIPASELWIDANFKEDQLARLRPGQVAEVAADAAPGRALKGRIASLAPGTGAVFSVIPPENATGNFTKIVQRVPVRIALDGAAASLGLLRPGLSVTVRVDTR
jgi:membrane fusion protein (multidrug efflux system)